MHRCKFTDEVDPTHFHCVRYIGPPLKNNFDKTAVYYKFENGQGETVTVMPLAFTWTEEGSESTLILPLWMKNMGNDFDALKFEKVIEAVEFDGTLILEWFSNLQPPSSLNRFPLEEILPQIFDDKRPLCNGTVLPFIFKGQRYLMRLKCDELEDNKIFWFNLESGSLDIKAPAVRTCSETLEILKNGSWKDDIKVLKQQLKSEKEKILFLICGVPLPLQKEFIELLEIEYEPIEMGIPDEHMVEDDEDTISTTTCNFNVLGEVEIISPNLMTEILKKISNQSIFLTSSNTIESSSNLLKLEKSAHNFNFQVLNFILPVLSEEERIKIILKQNFKDEKTIKSLKFSLNSLNFCDLLRVERIINTLSGNGNVYCNNYLEFALNCVKKTSANTSTNSQIMTLTQTETFSCEFPFFGYGKSHKEIENLIKGPLINPEAYDHFGLPKSSGFLIHGPTGCGKTFLCLKILSNPEFNQNFTIFHIPTASQLLSKYFGETEANIRKLFSEARERKPSIIFIDQLETLGRKRGLDSNNSSASNERYLSTLLNEMDGISGNEGVTILACANEIEILDEALLRPGRLDRHFYLGLPTETDRREIINGLLMIKGQGSSITSTIDLDELLKETDGLSGAEIKYLIKNKTKALQ